MACPLQGALPQASHLSLSIQSREWKRKLYYRSLQVHAIEKEMNRLCHRARVQQPFQEILVRIPNPPERSMHALKVPQQRILLALGFNSRLFYCYLCLARIHSIKEALALCLWHPRYRTSSFVSSCDAFQRMFCTANAVLAKSS